MVRIYKFAFIFLFVVSQWMPPAVAKTQIRAQNDQPVITSDEMPHVNYPPNPLFIGVKSLNVILCMPDREDQIQPWLSSPELVANIWNQISELDTKLNAVPKSHRSAFIHNCEIGYVNFTPPDFINVLKKPGNLNFIINIKYVGLKNAMLAVTKIIYRPDVPGSMYAFLSAQPAYIELGDKQIAKQQYLSALKGWNMGIRYENQK